MRRRAVYGLAGALVLSGTIAGFSAPRRPVSAGHESRGRPALAALASTYRVRLTSAWPRQTAPSECADAGSETLDGVLVQTGRDSYTGTFTRRTWLLFCGRHGADAAACELTLEGEGEVSMTAQVLLDETSPSGRSARLVWIPLQGHHAAVKGACAESFKRGVERMYLTVRHGAEVPLPAAGAAPIRQRLENYAYVAEIE
jgi:hypothetical protein